MAPKDYWSNTSGNDIVRRFLSQAGAEVAKREFEALIAGDQTGHKLRHG